MLEKITHALDKALYKRGFKQAEARRLMRMQLTLALVSSLVLLAATGPSVYAWSFAAGAVLISINFYFLAKVIPGLVQLRKGAVAPLLVQFYGRLILTGIVLFMLIAWTDVSVVALLAGLSTVVANAIVWGALYSVGQKVKEA